MKLRRHSGRSHERSERNISLLPKQEQQTKQYELRWSEIVHTSLKFFLKRVSYKNNADQSEGQKKRKSDVSGSADPELPDVVLKPSFVF